MHIRQIQVSDIEGFHSALYQVVLERRYLLTLEMPKLEDVEKFVSENIAKNYAQYVADSNGVIVGWSDIIPNQREALKHSGLLGMGVVKPHRGNGIGRNLLKCYSQAFVAGWSQES